MCDLLVMVMPNCILFHNLHLLFILIYMVISAAHPILRNKCISPIKLSIFYDELLRIK